MNGPLDQVASWPVRTAAVAVMSPAGLLAARGPLDRPFSWASVTKLLTTLAALDVVQRGLLDLDEPAGPPGATIRHLLAHASGLGPRGDKVLSKPGRQRIYSNRGIEIVAHATAARAGKPFGPLLAEEICRPLGLRRTHLAGSPSWGAAGPLGDLAALGSELLSPSLVDSELLAEATRTAFPGLPGVVPGFGRQPLCDWGLGFEIRDSKAPHWTGSRNSPATFGHFGRSGSFLWVDPEAGLACAALTDRDFGPWAARAWPRLSDDILTSYGSGLPVAGGQAQQVGDVHRPHLRLAAAQPLTELTQAAGIDRHHVIDPGRSDLVELGIQYPPGVARPHQRTGARCPAAPPGAGQVHVLGDGAQQCPRLAPYAKAVAQAAGVLQGHPGAPVPDPDLAEGLAIQVFRQLGDPVPADHGGQVGRAAAVACRSVPSSLSVGVAAKTMPALVRSARPIGRKSSSVPAGPRRAGLDDELWPRTLIATAAVQNLLGGDQAMAHARRPEVYADAAYAVITKPSRDCTGNARRSRRRG